jgi:hypothetical protein
VASWPEGGISAVGLLRVLRGIAEVSEEGLMLLHQSEVDLVDDKQVIPRHFTRRSHLSA